jgi:hypothetical protein
MQNTMIQCSLCTGACCVNVDSLPLCACTKARVYACDRCPTLAPLTKCVHCTVRPKSRQSQPQPTLPKTREERLYSAETRRLTEIAQRERQRIATIETVRILATPVRWDNVRNGIVTGDADV